MLFHRIDAGIGQRVQDLVQRLGESIAYSDTGTGKGGQTGGCPGPLGHTELDSAGLDQALQGLLATKQTQALLDLQQYRLVLACHPRGELQGPDSKTGAINGQRVVGYGVG
jgi:hypothetical protein